MEFSEILNYILGGGVLALLIGVLTLKATVREANAKAEQAKAEAERAKAEAESVRIDNAEHATRILIENIVEPLRAELHETRTELHETKEELRGTKKELGATKREMARVRKAIGGANNCKHSDNCPVLFKLRDLSKDGAYETGDLFAEHRGQHCIRSDTENGGKNSNVGSEVGDPDGKPP
ncbi:MAG: hypothetical protein IJB01_09540 [Bacteroidaceae bacterium]|nr:hypothetical protein [Bacteroidaceae bacterium]